MTAGTTTEVEAVTETWLSLGRRLDRDGKLFGLWRDADGDELGYDKLIGQPGRRYTIDVKRTTERTTVVLTSLAWLDALPIDDPERIAAEALDREAARDRERSLLAASDKRQSAIVELAMPIRVAMARTKGVARAALVAAVIDEMWRPLTKAEREEAGL